MVTRNVAIRLGVDGQAEVKRDFANLEASGKTAFKGIGEAADQAAARSTAAADRQMVAWRKQAAAARESVQRELAQANFNQTLGVRDYGGDHASRQSDLEAAFGSQQRGLSSLSAAGRVNLSYQGQDVLVSLLAGQNPLMVAAQQGSQAFGVLQAEGVKLEGTLLRLVAGWGLAAGALGLVGLAVHHYTEAADQRLAAERAALDIGPRLIDLNRQLANSTNAMVPVLLAEASALRAGAAAAREKLQADRDAAMRAADAERNSPTAARTGATPQRDMARMLDARLTAANGQIAWANVDAAGTELSAAETRVRQARRELSTMTDEFGRKITAVQAASLERSVQADVAKARTAAEYWQKVVTDTLATGNTEAAKRIALVEQSALDVIKEGQAGAATAGGSGGSGRSEAQIRAEQQAREAERAAALAAENAKRLTNLQLEDDLNAARVEGDAARIRAIEQEISLRRRIADFEGAGQDPFAALGLATQSENLRRAAERAAQVAAVRADLATARQGDEQVADPNTLAGLGPDGRFSAVPAPAVQMVDPNRMFNEGLGQDQKDVMTDRVRTLIQPGVEAAFRGGISGVGAYLRTTFFQVLANTVSEAFAKGIANAALAGKIPQRIMSLFSLPNFNGSLSGLFGGKGAPDPGASLYAPAHNARGTSNFGGGWTWVGEEEPELVKLPAGSQVLSGRDSRAKASRDGAGNMALHYAPVLNFSGGDDGARSWFLAQLAEHKRQIASLMSPRNIHAAFGQHDAMEAP